MAEVMLKPVSRRSVYALAGLCVVLFAAGGWDLFQVYQGHRAERLQENLLQQVSAHLGSAHGAVKQILSGKPHVLGRLQAEQLAYTRILNQLENGRPSIGLPPAQGTLGTTLVELAGGGALFNRTLGQLKAKTAVNLRIASALVNVRAGLPLLLLTWRHLGHLMGRVGAPPHDVALLGSLIRRAGLMERALGDLEHPVRHPAVLLNSVFSNGRFIAQVQNGILHGSRRLGMVGEAFNGTLRPTLNRTENLFVPWMLSLTTVERNAIQARRFFHQLSSIGFLSNSLAVVAHREQSRLLLSRASRIYRSVYGWALLAAGLVLMLLLFYVNALIGNLMATRRVRDTEAQRNQSAILKLLDELAGLSDGDLTVQASVTEDITGAIADSVNFAVDQLRELVRTINQTAVQVDNAARRTRATANHLAEASLHQTRQIAQAGEQIAAMTKSIEQVSLNAKRSAEVAQRSVGIANRGANAVRATIEGMNTIRDTIQETAKRIKRLGESSQEIGDIVELINDIAEQTNILALNAAIQASMAGEAGRGFAVVADEVQRLAERVGNATRQIETLVRTIQTDTGEAVNSMEKSTSGVVSGAQLAENAGRALTEIETVSGHMAKLVQSISDASVHQANASQDVVRTMNVIQEITAQTAEGTEATARDIGQLAELAGTLRQTVSGFKLPDEQEPEAQGDQEPAGTPLAQLEATSHSPPELNEEVFLNELSVGSS
jgi:twitching motility protein PilJ